MTGGPDGERGRPGGEWAPNPLYRRRAHDAAATVTGIIDGAEHAVVASTFLLADDRVTNALLRASDRGARCYLLLAAEERLARDAGTEFEAEARRRHVQTLGRLEGAALVRSSAEFHAKAVVADPMGGSPRGVIMTANLTREALGRNEELFVELEAAEAAEAALVLREALWERATHELVGGDLRSCAPLGKVGRAETHRILQGGSDPQLACRLAEMLDGDPGSVVASSFGWDASHPVVERLCRLAGGGADVTILARKGRPGAMEALHRLRSAGARVVGFTWLHAKALVTESDAVVMSANMERRGLGSGFEMGIALDGERASGIRAAVSRWADNWEFELTGGPRRPRQRGGGGGGGARPVPHGRAQGREF